MEIYERLLSGVELPKLYRVRMDVRQTEIHNVAEAVNRALDASGALKSVFAGASVAIASGSREIDRMDEVLRALIDRLRALGAEPFLVPAMGSHGGATAQGQREVIAKFGITQEAMGVPILSCMDTVCIGEVGGHEVHIDQFASRADFIIPVGRVKAHPEFLGQVESGLMKMLAVGLGKQHGAALCHRYGFPNMGENVYRFGEKVIELAPILFGLALIENRCHRLHTIEAVPAAQIPIREPELLGLAKSLMPKLPFAQIDVLLISEMGKEISGSGADPNITGHSGYKPREAPDPERVVVLDLTEKSKGNASGVGLVDVITRRLWNKIDLVPMYVNSITCHDTLGARIPMIMDSDSLAIRFAIDSCVRYDRNVGQTLAWIRNTASIDEFFLSENALSRMEHSDNHRVVEGPLSMDFDGEGALISPTFLSREGGEPICG